MDFHIVESTNAGILSVGLRGRFDAYNSDAVESKLNQLLDKKTLRFILDLKDVTYLGSCGIRILIAVTHRLKDLGGKFAIINLNPASRKILGAMEIEWLFNIFDTRDDAVKFINT